MSVPNKVGAFVIFTIFIFLLIYLRDDVIRTGKSSKEKIRFVNICRNTSSRAESTKRQRLPGALIIGSAKCGTSALYQYLALHPDVVRAKTEVRFFCNYYWKGLNWYRKQMPVSEPGQITIEKSPTYIFCPQKIRRHLPRTKFIWTVCDPVRRAVSLYQFRTFYNAPLYRNKSFVAMTMKKQHGHIVSVNKSSGLIWTARYSQHVYNWLRYFPKKSLYIVDGDQLKTNLVTQLQGLEKFLGLKPYLNESLFVKNDFGFHCLKTDKGRECVKGYKGAAKHPAIDPQVEKKLREYFAPYNERFFSIINRTFPWNSNLRQS